MVTAHIQIVQVITTSIEMYLSQVCLVGLFLDTLCFLSSCFSSEQHGRFFFRNTWACTSCSNCRYSGSKASMAAIFFFCCLFLLPLLFHQSENLTTIMLLLACVRAFLIVFIYAPKVDFKFTFLYVSSLI